MPRGADPDVAIPILCDGVDLVFGQTGDVRKGGDRLAIPHAQGTALFPRGQVPMEAAEPEVAMPILHVQGDVVRRQPV